MKVKRLSRSMVKFFLNSFDFLQWDMFSASVLWYVLPDQSIRILVQTAFKWAIRMRKIHGCSGQSGNSLMSSKFRSVICCNCVSDVWFQQPPRSFSQLQSVSAWELAYEGILWFTLYNRHQYFRAGTAIDSIDFPVTEPALGSDLRWSFVDRYAVY